MNKKHILFKRMLVIGIIILFVGTSVTPSLCGTNVIKYNLVDKRICLVDYRSRGYIQDLIDNASDGDTIYIPSGIYYESIIIDKSISLIGEDKENTIIYGNQNGNGYGFQVSADWVNISGFTIRNCSSPGPYNIGIEIFSNFTNITENKLASDILIDRACNNTITDNIVSFGAAGAILIFNYSSNNLISSNNGLWCLIFFSNNNTVENNNIFNCYWTGIYIEYSNYNIIKGNGIYNNSAEAILIGSSNDNTIIDNILSNNSEGIGLYECYRNTITGNTFMNNDRGIRCMGSSNDNLIYHNNFVNNTDNSYDGCNNIWDDGKYGNYWSDYEERYPNAKPKSGKPWMWDTPYEIPGDGGNKDNCPLIKQWPNTASKDILQNKAVTSNLLLLRILERFPLLQKLLQQLGL